jgi:hypothetical protein
MLTERNRLKDEDVALGHRLTIPSVTPGIFCACSVVTHMSCYALFAGRYVHVRLRMHF